MLVLMAATSGLGPTMCFANALFIKPKSSVISVSSGISLHLEKFLNWATP